MGTGITDTHAKFARMDLHISVGVCARNEHHNVPPEHGRKPVPHVNTDGRTILTQVYRPPHCGMVSGDATIK